MKDCILTRPLSVSFSLCFPMFITSTLSSNDLELYVTTPPAKPTYPSLSFKILSGCLHIPLCPGLHLPDQLNLLLCGSFCSGFFISWLWALAQFLPYLWKNNPTTAFSSESRSRSSCFKTFFPSHLPIHHIITDPALYHRTALK